MLIKEAKGRGVDFIYAISPGLDITFSNQKESAALKRKLDQVLLVFVILTLVMNRVLFIRLLHLAAHPLQSSLMILILTFL